MEPKKHRKWPWILLIVAVLLAAVAVACYQHNVRLRMLDHGVQITFDDRQEKRGPRSGAGKNADTARHRGERTLETRPSPDGTDNLGDRNGLSLQEIYRRAAPSVVTVTTGDGVGIGTGVVMTADGYIITNCAGPEQTSSLDVELADGTRYPAGMVGSDPATDLAVLKIDAEALTPAEFGDSDSLAVGDLAVTIGSPQNTDLRGIMAPGIIAGIGREETVGGRKMALIRTSAVLSGGPLLNCYGQVVGIHMTQGGTEETEGLGTVVPISAVKPIVEELISKGYVSGRPAIGVTVEALPVQAQLYYGLPDGAFVTAVAEGSDAAAKGMARGDIITALNGEAVTGPESLRTLKNNYAAGDTVTLTVFRNGGSITVEVVLMEQTADQ